jgi:ABC-type sugar transport system permease subunit
MRAENFIYFSTVSGFFISIVFGILKDFDVFHFLGFVFTITFLFYIISLASSAFFIKYSKTSKFIMFNKYDVEKIVNSQIKELEKKENFIYENYEFLKKLEEEELKILKNKNA